jgi:hypothetical protein
MTADLCHVFVFVDDCAAALAALSSCGLRETFRRTHPGQGTANVCACFDNAYLELLWPESPAELGASLVARTRLAERSRWRDNGASPFGIGMNGRLPFPCWDYRPPFLPDGVGIQMSLTSDDPRQPLLFRSPGGSRPQGCQPGLREILGIHLDMPVAASPAIRALAETGFLTASSAVRHRMLLKVSTDSGGYRLLSLPDFVWVE